MLRILLVEQAASIQKSMSALLSDLGFRVAAGASSMASAIAMVRLHEPDIVIASTRLPDGDGVELSKLLLEERGIPILLFADSDIPDPDLFREATRAGALDVLPKPPAPNDPDYERATQHLARTIRTLAGVRIMSRKRDWQAQKAVLITEPLVRPRSSPAEGLIIAVGASTGGPMVVGDILRSLGGGSFAFALVIQHMVPEFIAGFATWLETQIHVPVRLAMEGMAPEKGSVYLAPPGCQMLIEPSGRFRLPSAQVMPSPHVPSIDLAFLSLSKFRPARTIAILLTGMGQDGAEGLKALRAAKAFTIAQTPQSAVLASMPERAIALGAAMVTLSPDDIHKVLVKQLVGE